MPYAEGTNTPLYERMVKMAERPVFAYKDGMVNAYTTTFEWYSGFAISQQQKCIRSLHKNAKMQYGFESILEISSKSESAFGVKLSAFNLKLNNFSVECIFQSSKKFADGGPYSDILFMTSKNAKQDPRLRNSGKLVSFEHNGMSWGLKPTTAFYDYIYLKALIENGLLEAVRGYDAYTDIAFNPKKSLNCQARSCSISHSDELVESVAAGDIDRYLKLHRSVVRS